MEELIQQVSTRTGLSPDQAKGAAKAVIDFLKAKLPSPLAGQIDSLLSDDGVAGATGAMGAVTGALGDLFGKK